jgi:hypothetical protein
MRSKKMKAKKCCLLVLSAVVGVAACGAAHCDTIVPELMSCEEFGYSALRGISGVKVEVVHLFSAFGDNKLRSNPIIVEELQTYAEQLLTDAGIWVTENTSQASDAARLVITVNTWETVLISEFIVQVKAQLYQDAELVAGNRLRLMAETWPVGDRALEANMTEVIRLREMKREVEQQVHRQVGMFIHDYLSANPGRPRIIKGIGTVRYIDLEGGFYGIFGRDGSHCDPVNLPAEFAIDGLCVQFRGRILKDAVSYHMWGKIVQLIDIEGIGCISAAEAPSQ